jgi:hypothetical protein
MESWDTQVIYSVESQVCRAHTITQLRTGCILCNHQPITAKAQSKLGDEGCVYHHRILKLWSGGDQSRIRVDEQDWKVYCILYCVYVCCKDKHMQSKLDGDMYVDHVLTMWVGI